MFKISKVLLSKNGDSLKKEISKDCKIALQQVEKIEQFIDIANKDIEKDYESYIPSVGRKRAIFDQKLQNRNNLFLIKGQALRDMMAVCKDENNNEK